MMHSGRNMVNEIHNQVKANLSAAGIFLIAFVLVVREGSEVAIFSFAGEYEILPVIIGLTISALLAIGIYFSLFRVNLKVLFSITLGYLILQAGYLLGYGIHEGLSALGGLNYINESSWLFTKAFDVSDTIFYHKEGALGLPLNVLVGWYSKPEWIQLAAHYGYVLILFIIWSKLNRTNK
jgi:high-affinity iron transporter